MPIWWFSDLPGLTVGSRLLRVNWRDDRQREQQTTGRGTFVLLSFRPGEAFQFDWSEDFAVLGGERTKLQVAHIKLSHSRVFLVREGKPVVASFQRWSDASPDKEHRLQPFGAVMSDFRDVAGNRLPLRVEAGNMFGTDDYFPFFLADVTKIRFPRHQP